MKNKTIDIILIFFIIFIFISYFVVRHNIFNNKIKFKERTKVLEKYVDEGKWDEAKKIGEDLNKNWIKAKHIIMLNYAEEDFTLMEESISRIIKSIERKDANQALDNIQVSIKLWDNFNKFIPEP